MNTTVPVEGSEFDAAARAGRVVHLAIGMFDGVHRGHRAVIDTVVKAAAADGGIAAVLTFCPHPSALFRPENPTRLIQDAPTKARMLKRLGIDHVIVQRFDAALAGIEAEAFVPWLLERLPRLTAIHVGENFRFGRGRRGDVSLLVDSGRRHGVRVAHAARVICDGEPISSTRIRAQLEAGGIETANALLGYRYRSEGVVTGGKRLGRTLGFPTLNLPWAPECRPRLGVYAVKVGAADQGPVLPGVANYGLRPTVEQAIEPRLEVHVLGTCPFGEGERIAVEWVHFLRPEVKFAGVEELRAQISRDRAQAEVLLQAST